MTAVEASAPGADAPLPPAPATEVAAGDGNFAGEDAQGLWACGRPRQLDYALVVVFTLFCVAVNALWIQLDQRPPMDDDKRHLSLALAFYRTMRADASLGERFTRMELWDCNLGDGYPPGLYAVTSAVFTVMGPSVQAALMSVQLFLAVLILACFELGFMFGGRAAAFGLVGMVGGAQVVVAGSREYLLDLPMTALVTLAYLLLLRSQGFRRRAPSIAFGGVLAVSMLVKWSSALLLIAPALYVAWPLLRRPDYDVLSTGLLGTLGVVNLMLVLRRTVFDHSYGLSVASGPADPSRQEVVAWVPPFLWIVVSLVALLVSWRLLVAVARSRPAATPLRHCFEGLMAALAVAGPWYVWQIHAVLWLPVRAYLPSFSTWTNARADALIIAIQAPMLLALVAIGLIVAVVRRVGGTRGGPSLGPSFLAALVGFLALGFGVLTHWRYTLPIIPFVGIVATYWLSLLGPVAWMEVAVLLGHAVYQLAGWMAPAVVGLPPPSRAEEFLVGRPVVCLRPDTMDYGIESYLRHLERLSFRQDGAPPSRCLVIGSNLTLSSFCCLYQMVADYHDLDLRMVGLIRQPTHWALLIYSDDWLQDLFESRKTDATVLIFSESPQQLNEILEALKAPVWSRHRGRMIQGRLELVEPLVGPPPDPKLLRYLGTAHLFRARIHY